MSSERMKKIYYNAEIINDTTEPVEAKYDVGLLSAIVDNPLKYNVNVNRFRLPLNGIPLTRNNIPFEQWQVSLGFNNGGTWAYQDEFVNQYGATLIESVYSYFATANTGNILINQFQNDSMAPTGLSYSFAGTGKPFMHRILTPYSIIASASGLSSIYLLNPQTLTLQTTITTAYPIVNYTVSTTNDIYTITLNNGIYLINRYQLVSGTWTANATYTNYLRPIQACSGFVFVNGYLYVSDSSQNLIYYWNAAGEPTGLIDGGNLNQNLNLGRVNNILLANVANTTLIDKIFGLKSNYRFFDITNNDALWSYQYGDYNYQIATANNVQYYAGTDNKLYYTPYGSSAQPALASAAVSIRAIGATQQGQIIIFGVGNIMYLWNGAYVELGYARTTSSDATGQIKSFDFLQNKKMLAISLNNTLYLSNLPITQYKYLVAQSTGNMQFVGMDYNNSKIYVGTNNISCFNGANTIAYMGPNFYVLVNPSGTQQVNVYNNAFVLQTQYTLSETSNNIVGIFANSNYSPYLFVWDGANNVRIYNTSGAQQGTVNVGAAIVSVCVASSTVFIVLTANNIYAYNYSSPSSITNLLNSGLPRTGPVSMCYAPNLNNNGAIGGVYVSFSDANTISTLLFQPNYASIMINGNPNITQLYYKMQYNQTTQNTVCAFRVANNIIYADILTQDGTDARKFLSVSNTNIVGSSSITSPAAFSIDYLYSGMVQFTAFTSTSLPSSVSVCCSRYDNQVYVLGGSNSLLYSSPYNPSTPTTLNFVRMSQYPYDYWQISCASVPYGSPNNVLATYTAPQSPPGGFSLTGPANFISNDSNNNIVVGYSSNITTYTTSGSTVSVSNISNIQGSTYSKPEYAEAGNYKLWSYQDYLYPINQALTTAFNGLVAKFGSAYQSNAAPYITFSASTRLFSLHCTTNYQSTTNYKIFMNPALMSMFAFPNLRNNTQHPGFYPIVVQEVSNNEALVVQENSTVAAFFEIVRILISTSKIPVLGDVEGTNNTVNLITDVVPDTNTLTPNDILIYQPSILRNYNLDSNIPIKDLNLQFYYGCKDGSIHKVELLSGEYASVKLEFLQVIV